MFPEKGNPEFADGKMLSSSDEKFLVASCNLSGSAGFGLSAIEVRDVMRNAIAMGNIKNPKTGELFRPDLPFVRKWMQRHGVKARKSSGIDRQRAVKATAKLRDDW